jgi:transcriptional regulator with XRE-family HTH domain
MLPEGRLIKAARILVGWSQGQLAQRAGVGRNSLYRLEADQADSRASTIEKLTEALAQGGIRFIPATEDHQIGIALRKLRPASGPSANEGRARSTLAHGSPGTDPGRPKNDRKR